MKVQYNPEDYHGVGQDDHLADVGTDADAGDGDDESDSGKNFLIFHLY